MTKVRKDAAPAALREKDWPKRAVEKFLARLAELSCVKMAAEHAGLSLSGLYHHRNKNPDFAARWDIAIDIGYSLLEAEMLRRARFGEAPSPEPEETADASSEAAPETAKEPPPPVKAISTQLGLTLLKLHFERIVRVRAARLAHEFGLPDKDALSRTLQRRLEVLAEDSEGKRAQGLPRRG